MGEENYAVQRNIGGNAMSAKRMAKNKGAQKKVVSRRGHDNARDDALRNEIAEALVKQQRKTQKLQHKGAEKLKLKMARARANGKKKAKSGFVERKLKRKMSQMAKELQKKRRWRA